MDSSGREELMDEVGERKVENLSQKNIENFKSRKNLETHSHRYKNISDLIPK